MSIVKSLSNLKFHLQFHFHLKSHSLSLSLCDFRFEINLNPFTAHWLIWANTLQIRYKCGIAETDANTNADMLLLKHMFYNKIRGRHRRYFMCPLERVLLPFSLFLSLSGRAAFMVAYPGYGATQHNQSFAARGEAAPAAAARKCVQRLLMCLTFVVCAKRVEGTLRKCDVHRILHLTVCASRGRGNEGGTLSIQHTR